MVPQYISLVTNACNARKLHIFQILLVNLKVELKVCSKQTMFGNSFYFLFSKTCFWEYEEKTIFFFLVFLKSKTCFVN